MPKPEADGFAGRVYTAVSKIPRGRVASYGQIAEMIGCPGGSRAVGNALHANPYAPQVPCHRVVAADGSVAARYGLGGGYAQQRRLLDEGVAFLDTPARSGMPRVDMARCGIVIEIHPLDPFLPDGAGILFLGSFPPPKERWSMDFFYPNFTNDFWRIQGLIHWDDARHFEERPENGTKPVRFDRERIVAFCREKGLAFYDTARKICRLKGNASDAFLEILEPADLPGMLARLPDCRTVVTTGGKSSEEFLSILTRLRERDAVPGSQAAQGLFIPAPGERLDTGCCGRSIRWWRMPSSSRAYPMALAEKAKIYARLWESSF